ncbi:MAG: hypothetical protein IPJ19_20315 [Planctomycetes bacterium]|nr:hypothetical protein [Planctomycetota bacterium]
MARKPLLLAFLLIVLAIAGWLVAREIRFQNSQPGSGPLLEGPARQAAGESERTQPVAGPAREPTALEASRAAQPTEELTASAFVLRGRIVDERRLDAAGAEVRLVRANGATRSVRSDESGRFEFTIPARPLKWESVALWALRDENAAVRTLGLPGSEAPSSYGFLRAPTPLGDVDAGTLTLRQAQSLHIRVVDAGEPAVGAEVALHLGVDPTVLWRGTSDAAGKLTSPALPGGCANLEAVRGGAEGRARVFLPEEREVRIELAPRYEALITLVEKQSGAPIAGAVVGLDETVQAPSSENSKGMGFGEYITMRKGAGGTTTTDAGGMAHFPNLSASADYRVQVRAPGVESYPPQGSGGERVGAAKPNLRIELARVESRSVRWPIAAGEVPQPPEGARILLRPAPGSGRVSYGEPPPPPREGVVRDGQVVAQAIEGRGFFLGTAPDGSIARFFVDEKSELGTAVSFRKPRTVELYVHAGDLAPVAHALAQARNQGNNPLGEPASTDADGLAKLTGLYGELAEVYVLGPTDGAREVNAGSVNLENGDARVELVLPASASMRARLTVRIDGAAQLPPEYQLHSAKVLEEFPERGELLLEVALPATGTDVSLAISSPGFLPASVKLPIGRDGTEARAVLELTRSSMLTAIVTRPRNQDWVEIQIQSWNEAKRTWGRVPHYFNGLSTPNGPDGSFRFFQLAPGRYQVSDARSKIASEPVEIAAGQAEASVALDLDGVEWVSGRVEVPDPAELSRVRVLSSASPSSSGTPWRPGSSWLPGMAAPPGAYPSADGSFKLQVKRGVSTTLRAWHPWLAPADPGGEIVVDAGREGVVLKLASGDQVRLEVPQLAELPSLAAARVGLYEGPAKGEPRTWLHAPLVEGALRFTGVPRGRATLWIDAGREYAPLVLTDVEIGAGLTDLGTAEFSRGSSLRIRQSVKEGQAAARIYISAQREQAPALFRDLNSNGETTAVLSGLEAGTYRVSYGAIMDGKNSERQLEIDGVSDVELELQ